MCQHDWFIILCVWFYAFSNSVLRANTLLQTARGTMARKRLRGPGLAPSAPSSARWAATGPDGARTIAHVCICGPAAPAPLSPPSPPSPRPPGGKKPVCAGPASGLASPALSLGPWRQPVQRPSWKAILGACEEAPGAPYKAAWCCLNPRSALHPGLRPGLTAAESSLPLPT